MAKVGAGFAQYDFFSAIGALRPALSPGVLEFSQQRFGAVKALDDAGSPLAATLVDIEHLLAQVDDALMRAFQLVARFIDRHDDGFLPDRKSTRLNSSHAKISYAGTCLNTIKSYMIILA